ncbi:MAG: carboxypeptidase regulatory-like domain-containing protein [Planctomycetes bacterium]|nr:carboxypeptidase regulatory-like domain-containing protein [Planctomycetota bacterium]
MNRRREFARLLPRAKPSFCLGVLAVVALSLMSLPAADPLGRGVIEITSLTVDVDTRPDLEGLQSTLTAVKDFPAAIQTIVGLPESRRAGFSVSARLVGPAFGGQALTFIAPAGGRFEIPPLGQEGTYFLDDIHLLDAEGRRVLNRRPERPRVEIQVIDQILVTEVITRPLTLEEIREKGIVIDEKSFSVLNFSMGLSIGGKQVQIDVPIIQPKTPGIAVPQLPQIQPPQTSFVPFKGPDLEIPNFQVGGFFLEMPPELGEIEEIRLPGLPGLIIIPGDVGFLNQFFSALLIVQNVAPGGSGLSVSELKARIKLPAGPDGIPGTGDDVLRVARTQASGVQEELPIRRALVTADGKELLTQESFLLPQERGKAEFLLEGLREGTHAFDIDIAGRLFVPSRGQFFDLKGKAAGAVVVRNPTFNLVLAHPQTVREGERYSLFATVSNTSQTDANLFRIRLSERSLTGTVLVPGTPSGFTRDSLKAGESETFEFRLESRRTGSVGGTVFQADDGITGSFVLTAGVSERGIPLSPDTLVLPSFLTGAFPDPPPLERDVLRILGQAWSIATAPAGSLPPGILRPSRDGVKSRAVGFAARGLRILFGEPLERVVTDYAFDYLETEFGRLEAEFPAEKEAERARARADHEAFDRLVRSARQGRFVPRDIGEILRQAQLGGRLAGALEALNLVADAGSGRAPYLAAAIGRGAGGVPARLRLVDPSGRRAGANRRPDLSDPDGDDGRARDLPFADVIPLLDAPGSHAEIALAGSVADGEYFVEIHGEGDGETDLAIACQTAAGVRRLVFAGVPLAPGSVARAAVRKGSDAQPALEVDLDEDGLAEQTIAPSIDTVEPDAPPAALSARQWGKGPPSGVITLEKGDPFGRLVGILFSERVEKASAEDVLNYTVLGNRVSSAALQPDRRIAFLFLEQPINPLDPVETIQIQGVKDLAGNAMAPAELPIDPDPDLGLGGPIEGIVRRANGQPVAGATVVYSQTICDIPFTEGCVELGITSVTTGADGRYSMPWILANTARPEFPPKIRAVDLAAGEEGELFLRPFFKGQLLRGDVILRGFGIVTGEVVDEEGRRVGSVSNGADGADEPGKRVIIEITGAAGAGRTGAVAGADGAFIVPQVPVGAVIIKAIDERTGAAGVVAASVPEADATIEVRVILFQVKGNVAGRVLRLGGEPAAGVPVVARAQVPIDINSFGVQKVEADVGLAFTDAAGGFEIRDVPGGPFTVRSFDPATYEQAEARGFLDDGETAEVTLVFPGAGGIVRGLVVDSGGRPSPFALVAGGPAIGKADELGRFELRNFPIGRFKITAKAADSFASGDVEIDIISGGDVQEVLIRLRPLGSIAGRVLEADGATPVKEQPVILWTNPSGGQAAVLYRTRTSSSGAYLFDQVPAHDLRNPALPGRWRVQSVRRGSSTEDGSEESLDGGETFTELRFQGEVRNVNVIYRGRGVIRGRLVQTNGTPAIGDVLLRVPAIKILSGFGVGADFIAERTAFARSLIQAYASILDEFDTALPQEAAEFLAATNGPSEQIFPFFVSKQILFKVQPGAGGVVDGKFETEPQLAGTVDLQAQATLTAVAARKGEIPRTRDAASRLLDFGDIVLTPAVGEIAGRVLPPDGATPVGRDVKVTLQVPRVPPIDVLTDDEGRFAFPLAPVGPFCLIADTGTPPVEIAARSAAEIVTNTFQDAQGKRALNVRLFGKGLGELQPDGRVEVDLRLQGAAGVAVRVEREDGTAVQGASVTLRTLFEPDGPVESSFEGQSTDSQGLVDFLPVTEGAFQVTASELGNPRLGLAAGAVPARPRDGLSIPIAVILGKSVSAGGAVVAVERFGAVRGRVVEPDGSVFLGAARIQVQAAGATLESSTGADGAFEVAPVPAGAVFVAAHDLNTNRRAQAQSVLPGDGAVDLTLRLNASGTVSGRVLSFGGDHAIPGAVVRLDPPAASGVTAIVTQSDLEGRFRFSGVPEGAFALSAGDPATGAKGFAQGSVGLGAEDLEVDVRLGPLARLEGVVFAAGVRLGADGRPVDGNGDPFPDAPVTPFAELSLEGPAISRGATADGAGAFRFENLPPGTYRLTAKHPTAPDGEIREARLTEDGETAQASLSLRGLGIVSGEVRDSISRSAVAFVRVTLSSQSPFARGLFSRLTGQDGAFRFEDVPAGAFSLQAVTTVGTPPLGASAAGEIAAPGQEIAFFENDGDPERGALILQDSGSALGRVLERGAPRALAVVTLLGGGERSGSNHRSGGPLPLRRPPPGDLLRPRRESLHRLSRPVCPRARRQHPGGGPG